MDEAQSEPKHGEHWDLDTLRGAIRYQKWLLSSFGNALSGEVLEVGGGNGNFTRWIAPKAKRVVLVEPDSEMCRLAAELSLPGVDIVNSTIESIESERQSFDAVVMINVLEHIEDDAAAIRIASRLLRPGGRLCIAVPAHRLLYGSLDKHYGHFRRYRRKEVASLITRAGFRLDTSRYFNPIGAIGWFLVTRIGKAKKISKSSITMSEHIAVPIGKTLERLGGPPFGQSVVAVGVKTS